jgi:hypothetical protein
MGFSYLCPYASYLLHIYSYYAPPATTAVGTGKLGKLFVGQGHNPPIDLNTPPTALVDTIVEYLVLVLIPHAVICEQSHLTNGYTVVVSPPILKATGVAIVAVVGIA